MAKHPVIWGSAWLVAVVGAVGLGLVPGDYSGESLCGVWGCFPPLQALASLHLLWLLALVPATMIIARSCRVPIGKRSSAFVFIVGLAVTCSVIVSGLNNWDYPWAELGHPEYAVWRAGYTLAMRTDVPGMELTVAGLAGLLATCSRATHSPTSPAASS